MGFASPRLSLMASGGGGGGNGQELRMESASSPKLSAQLGAIREVAGITVGGPASHFPASHRPLPQSFQLLLLL